MSAEAWIAIGISALTLLSTWVTRLSDKRRAAQDTIFNQKLEQIREAQVSKGVELANALKDLDEKVGDVIVTQRSMSGDIAVLKATQAVHEDRFARPSITGVSRNK